MENEIENYDEINQRLKKIADTLEKRNKRNAQMMSIFGIFFIIFGAFIMLYTFF